MNEQEQKPITAEELAEIKEHYSGWNQQSRVDRLIAALGKAQQEVETLKLSHHLETEHAEDEAAETLSQVSYGYSQARKRIHTLTEERDLARAALGQCREYLRACLAVDYMNEPLAAMVRFCEAALASTKR